MDSLKADLSLLHQTPYPRRDGGVERAVRGQRVPVRDEHDVLVRVLEAVEERLDASLVQGKEGGRQAAQLERDGVSCPSQ